MRKQRTVKDEKIIKAKKLLAKNISLRQVAEKSKISYYTTWNISKGKYDTKEPLVIRKRQDEYFEHNRTGIF